MLDLYLPITPLWTYFLEFPFLVDLSADQSTLIVVSTLAMQPASLVVAFLDCPPIMLQDVDALILPLPHPIALPI